jgi:GNAT superfamily N-acetyltransferase
VSHPVLTTRRAWPADAETLGLTVHRAIQTWRAFAPAGWEVPTAATRTAGVRIGFARPGAWALLAFVDGEPAGHCGMFDADMNEPRATILWHLFVRPRWFGTGLAAYLHDTFVDRAQALDYPFAWLATPAANARARRFYERRGWTAGTRVEEHDGLPWVIYGRPLLP